MSDENILGTSCVSCVPVWVNDPYPSALVAGGIGTLWHGVPSGGDTDFNKPPVTTNPARRGAGRWPSSCVSSSTLLVPRRFSRADRLVLCNPWGEFIAPFPATVVGQR